MLKYCELIADRLLEVIVPRADAGACPCGDAYCTTFPCDATVRTWRHYTNCNCQVVHKDCSCRNIDD